jgi:hypothetical protein
VSSFGNAAAKSNEVLKQLGPDIQWQESFVAGDKTLCLSGQGRSNNPPARGAQRIHRHQDNRNT